MVSEEHQVLLNALANGLEADGGRVTGLERRGMRKPFDKKYWNLPPPDPVDRKTPDLQGWDGGRLILGEAEMSPYGSHTESQLGTFVRHVMHRSDVSLYVAVPLEHSDAMENKIRRSGWEYRKISYICVWPFEKIGHEYIPRSKQYVR